MKNIKDFINESKNSDVYNGLLRVVDKLKQANWKWNDEDLKKYLSDIHNDLSEKRWSSKDLIEFMDIFRDISGIDTDNDDFNDELIDALEKFI